MTKQQQKTLVEGTLAIVTLVVIGLVSAWIFFLVTRPTEAKTEIKTDVMTKDIIIKSERDLSTAADDLNAMTFEEKDSAALDELGSGL